MRDKWTSVKTSQADCSCELGVVPCPAVFWIQAFTWTQADLPCSHRSKEGPGAFLAPSLYKSELREDVGYRAAGLIWKSLNQTSVTLALDKLCPRFGGIQCSFCILSCDHMDLSSPALTPRERGNPTCGCEMTAKEDRRNIC